MKARAIALSLISLTLLSACDQPRQDASAASSSTGGPQASTTELPPTGAGPAAVPEPPLPEVSPADREAYVLMEAQYVGDPAAQWASSAKASTSFGEGVGGKALPANESRAWKATGLVDGDTWSNASDRAEGVDWLELGFDRPASTAEIRVVMKGRAAVDAITRVDVIEEGGQYHTIWEGPSDVRQDVRGNRTWFVRRFEKTPYKVQGVKLTFANHACPGFKEVDAVQLVGR